MVRVKKPVGSTSDPSPRKRQASPASETTSERKRGRKNLGDPNISADATADEVFEPAVEKQPARRGRPAKKVEEKEEVAPAAENATFIVDAPPKKEDKTPDSDVENSSDEVVEAKNITRGRKGSAKEKEVLNKNAPVEKQTARRGRAPKKIEEKMEEAPGAAGNATFTVETAPPARRGRPAKKTEAPAAAEIKEEAKESEKKGRGRPKKVAAPTVVAAPEEEEDATAAAEMGEEAKEPEKKGRGRPKKGAAPTVVAAPEEEDATAAAEMGEEAKEPEKKGRGRQKKGTAPAVVAAPEQEEEEAAAAAAAAAVVEEGAGSRGKKAGGGEKSAQEEEEEPTAVAKPGRKKAVVDQPATTDKEDVAEAPKAKRGRPPKASASTEEQSAGTVVAKGRSGRKKAA